MTVHEVLRRALRKGIKVLVFDWTDGKKKIPTIKLLVALEEYVGEDVDEHTRPDYAANCQHIIDDLSGTSCVEDRIIAQMVWDLNVTYDAERYATQAIYKAIVESMLGG